MTLLQRLSRRVTSRTGTIAASAMVILGLASSVAIVGTAAEDSAKGGAATPEPRDETSIRPFKFHASDEALADLRRRIAATRWPERETDATQGVRLATMQKLASYWAKDYDWRKAEAKLNSYPQFITNIDGVDIHFI